MKSGRVRPYRDFVREFRSSHELQARNDPKVREEYSQVRKVERSTHRTCVLYIERLSCNKDILGAGMKSRLAMLVSGRAMEAGEPLVLLECDLKGIEYSISA